MTGGFTDEEFEKLMDLVSCCKKRFNVVFDTHICIGTSPIEVMKELDKTEQRPPPVPPLSGIT